MKNPGSAQPLQMRNIKSRIRCIGNISEQQHPMVLFHGNNTMQLIEKLFVARDEGKP